MFKVTVVLVFLFLTLIIFHTFFYCFCCYFEETNVRWVNFNFSQFHEHIFRSSHSQIFFKIGVLKSLRNFTGKHLCWSLFLKNLQAEALQLYLKSLQHCCFPVKFAKFLRTLFFTEHLRWLLLLFRWLLYFFKKVIKQLLLFRNLLMTY